MTQILERRQPRKGRDGRTRLPGEHLMNQEPEYIASFPGDFSSETAVRRAQAARPDDAAARASRPRQLRRWSVAELVARGVARPSAAGAGY